MSRVKGAGNKATELRLIQIMREHQLRGWRRHLRIFGNPDFVFLSARLAVFVDGCFWHGCPIHGGLPATNKAFWLEKLSRNRRRDRQVTRRLKKSEWHVLRIWQHDLRNSERVAKRIRKFLM